MRALAGICLGWLVLVGCGGASADPGLAALLRVSPAQYVPGSPPSTGLGPAVIAVESTQSSLTPSRRDVRLKGFVEPSASAVAIHLRGDRGFWVATTGAPDVQVPGQLTFDVRMAVAAGLSPGPAEVVVQAVDREGQFGPPWLVPFEVIPPEPPAGELVVSLRWDNQADLDLHVVDPLGVEIWNRNMNSYEPPRPGQPAGDPNAWRSGGTLDFDSNAGCARDGRRQENVVWQLPPPPGRYEVRVDAASLCGAPAAAWEVTVLRAGAVVRSARGLAVDADTRGAHDSGAGILALEFEVD